MFIYTVEKLKENEISTAEWYYPTDLHKHTDWEIFALTEGTGANIVNGITYPYQSGTFILLGPQHLHQQISPSKVVRRDICISSSLFKKCCDELNYDLFNEFQQTSKPVIIEIDFSTFNDIVKRLKNIEKYNIINTDYSKSLLYSIVMYILGVYIENKQVCTKNNAPDWYIDFIMQTQSPDVFSKKIEEIIKITNYSQAYFLQLFKEYSGTTLIKYITSLRMQYASKLLLNTNLSIIQIANDVGYSNHSFFTQKFYDFFGKTPKDYRKDHYKNH